MIVGWFAAWFALENGLLSMNVCVFSVFLYGVFSFLVCLSVSFYV